MSNQDNRTASQKISDLENALMSLYQAVDTIGRDLNTAKDAIKLLGNKLDSVVKASSQGEPLTDAVISRIMIENNVAELADKVKVMAAQGVVVPTDQVANDSFLVGAEVNDLGETVNPRLQFALFAIKPVELQEKFVGARVGDLITVAEGRPKYKVQEIYKIQPQTPPQEEAAPAPEAPAAEAAPAEAPAEKSESDKAFDQPNAGHTEAPAEAAPTA